MILYDAVASNPHPRDIALRAGAVELEYGELSALVEATARAMLDAGVASGARLVSMLPNRVEHVVAALAAGSVGAVFVPCEPNVGEVRLSSILRETEPHYCLLAPGTPGPVGCGSLQLDFDPATVRVRVDTMRIPSEGGGRTDTSDSEGNAAFVRFTSGSTGRPKGVVLDHEQVVSTARALADCFGLGPRHRELVITSISYSGGWQRVAATLIAGGCVILAEEPFSIPGMLDDLANYDVTGFFAPPPVIRLLLASSHATTEALAGCRSIEVGSASIARDELEQLLALMPESRIFVHYGLTECSRAFILDARKHPDKLDTVGRAAPGCEASIRDDTGACCDPGQTGQVFVMGPQQSRGYWRRPDLNAERFNDGWLATGDYGMLDEEGFLKFLGRRDDRIESAGFSFFPAEVEAELGTLDGVEQYMIAGVPDPRGMLGDVPCAFVVPSNPELFSMADFSRHLRRTLPAQMVPREIVVLDALPLTASGKPNRRHAVEAHSNLKSESP